ncbi:hypothetical protein LTS08_006725 [Lithohypha guttulata]|nr:hypothetical protein LTS08_006725 [Lithohypha guttulata]
MADRRPWTPTEKPGDASYNAPVVYHGDHQMHGEESDASSDEETGLIQVVSPAGKEVVTKDETREPQSLRFRASHAYLKEEAAVPAPEATIYIPYRLPPTSDTSKDDTLHTLHPRGNSQVLDPAPDERSPAGNPYRLSKILGTPSDPALQKQLQQQNRELPNSGRPEQSQSNNPYRLSQGPRSESTEDLIIQPQKPTQASDAGNVASAPLAVIHRLSEGLLSQRSDSTATIKPRHVPQVPTIKAGDDLPSITGISAKEIKILLVNPNSTKSVTERCLESIVETLPRHVTVYGFTPSRPAPTAIESHTDAVMSTAACTKAILPIAAKYDAILVASFGHHSLVTALREHLMQPVIGIMEASLYASRMCGSKFGILTTGMRSMYTYDAAVKLNYGLGAFSVGAESTRLSEYQLENRPEEEVEERLLLAAKRLQARGADCICLGCAGVTDYKKVCQDAVGMHDRVAMVVDGVSMGVHFLIGLVRENLGTARGGAYNTNSGHKALKPRG